MADDEAEMPWPHHGSNVRPLPKAQKHLGSIAQAIGLEPGKLESETPDEEEGDNAE